MVLPLMVAACALAPAWERIDCGELGALTGCWCSMLPAAGGPVRQVTRACQTSDLGLVRQVTRVLSDKPPRVLLRQLTGSCQTSDSGSVRQVTRALSDK